MQATSESPQGSAGMGGAAQRAHPATGPTSLSPFLAISHSVAFPSGRSPTALPRGSQEPGDAQTAQLLNQSVPSQLSSVSGCKNVQGHLG